MNYFKYGYDVYNMNIKKKSIYKNKQIKIYNHYDVFK